MEGNAWQLTFFVPQDVPGLVKAIGADRFREHLSWVFNESVKCGLMPLMISIGIIPLLRVINIMIFNVLMMIGITSRMVPSGASTTGIPEPKDQGAFMSINSSLQQIAGGIAAAVAGMIVVQKTNTARSNIMTPLDI